MTIVRKGGGFDQLVDRLLDDVGGACEETASYIEFEVDANAPHQERYRIAAATEVERLPGRETIWNVVLQPGHGAFIWRFHEYGTVKMAARPFVEPAVLLATEFLRQRLRQATT